MAVIIGVDHEQRKDSLGIYEDWEYLGYNDLHVATVSFRYPSVILLSFHVEFAIRFTYTGNKNEHSRDTVECKC